MVSPDVEVGVEVDLPDASEGVPSPAPPLGPDNGVVDEPEDGDDAPPAEEIPEPEEGDA